VLGSLGITGSMSLQKIGTMSGGEKARVALASFALVPHNLLILDEPSNHLDAATVHVLTEALQEYKGTIVLVTHNRPFCELLAPTHIATVVGEPGSQTVKVEERPLRASDWTGMSDEVGGAGGGGGGKSGAAQRSIESATLSSKKAGKGKGSTTLKNKAAVAEEDKPARELYPWEMAELTDTGLKQNKQGKLVSKTKKLTPQQKKLEKMKMKGSMESWGGDAYTDSFSEDSFSGGGGGGGGKRQGKGGGKGGKKGGKKGK